MEPVIEDLIIGTLTHDGHYYNGTVVLGDTVIALSIGTWQVKDPVERLAKARDIVGALGTTIDRAKIHAANRLLPLKNDSWEEEDGRQIESREFIERLAIQSVTLDHDGDVVMYFEDGDLFFGHHVMVTQKQDGEWDRAELQG